MKIKIINGWKIELCFDLSYLNSFYCTLCGHDMLHEYDHKMNRIHLLTVAPLIQDKYLFYKKYLDEKSFCIIFMFLDVPMHIHHFSAYKGCSLSDRKSTGTRGAECWAGGSLLRLNQGFFRNFRIKRILFMFSSNTYPHLRSLQEKEHM